MGFLKHIRSRSKLKNQQPEAHVYDSRQYDYNRRPTAAGRLPPRVLDVLFSYVCPHTLDESYLSSEESMADDGCTLCNIRDLAHCAQMNRNWAEAVERRLYHSVRLDTVHYCDREIELSEKRKHKKKFDRNGDPGDPTQQRLKLFSETVRRNEYLASLVNLLKMPYMTRESCKADLARTVSVLPNLRFVDLPDGFFSEDASTLTLRQELQNRCPEIRKMKYNGGSEASFTQLAHSRMWQNLESLELNSLNLEADVLLYVLASFPALRNVKIGGDMSCLIDDILTLNPSLPPFPPLTRLSISHAPGITAHGLVNYLSRIETREVLASLELNATGVLAHELYQVLATAPYLTHLSYSESISKAFPIAPVPPLTSSSLINFAFEILPEHHTANPVSETYYNYLASSLLAGALPSLRECYAYSPSLPDLLFAPPLPPFGAGGGFGGGGGGGGGGGFDPTAQVLSSRFSTLSTSSSRSYNSSNSFHHSSASFHAPAPQPSFAPRAVPAGLRSPLALYTKSPAAPELEWSLTTIDPPSERNGRRGSASATRPLSLVLNERSSSPARSVVGNGFGGFLAVPGDEGANAMTGGQGNFGLSRGSATNGEGGFLSPARGSFGHARKASKVGVGMGEWMG